MRSILKATAVSLATLVALAGPASAELTGNLKINLDTSNPAPRATMEAMISRFQSLHPGLNITTTVIDREAYKTQIRNFLSADAPDVLTWYAANRMKPMSTQASWKMSLTCGTSRPLLAAWPPPRAR